MKWERLLQHIQLVQQLQFLKVIIELMKVGYISLKHLMGQQEAQELLHFLHLTEEHTID